MAFDFDRVIERRGTDSSKWNRNPDRAYLPMPVADMDFASAPVVIEALHKRAEHGVFGYADAPPWAIEAVQEKLLRDYGWEVQPHWLVWLPGLVVGLNVACRMLESAADAVVTTTPIYPPFLQAPDFTGHPRIDVPLVQEATRYEIPWEDLEARFTDPAAKLFLHCNPHNPAGRVMRRGEQEKLAELCLKHDVLICSDEIHCDLVLEPDLRHIPMAMISPEVAARTITLMSPSKAYNLAGLMWSFAVIPDDTLRRRFLRAARGIVTELNVFGYAGGEAAYRHGGDWHRELIQVLRRNRDLVRETVSGLPGLWMPEIEATYLAWIDCRGRKFSCEPSLHFEKNGLGLSHGSAFGARGFVRLNYGCPLSTLQEGLRRFREIVEALPVV
jgi:cysteine-S-conjugate beta-lyase